MDPSFWSLVPPLLTIALAIITKEVLMSLFIGVFTGSLILSGGNPLGALVQFIELLTGTYDETEELVIPGALTEPWNVQVIIIVVMLGGLIGLMVRSGGSGAFGQLLGKHIKDRKGAELTSWGVGLLIFFDDYFNALTNGAIMRRVTDSYQVSREKLSYIIDSTAVGICLIVPLSSWIAFICSLINTAYTKAGVEGNAFKIFVTSIPYNYYAWLSIIMVAMVIIFKMDYGPMAKAEKRTKETGALCDKTFSGGDADEDDFATIEVAEGGKAIDFLAPIILLVVLALTFMLQTGGFFKSFDLVDAFNNTDGMLALTLAISISFVFAILFYAVKKLSSITESLLAFVVGVKSMIFVLLLLSMAWSLGILGDKLGSAEYVSGVFQGNVPAFLLPLIIFAISCAMTFATGASWGTYAIMLPIAIPLAFAMDVTPLVAITAVIGGGGFGNHCSPLADTAILSSAAANIRHTDHIKTQIPYSVTCAACACVGFLLSGVMHGPIIPMLATLVVFSVAVFILSRLFGEKRYIIEAASEAGNEKEA